MYRRLVPLLFRLQCSVLVQRYFRLRAERGALSGLGSASDFQMWRVAVGCGSVALSTASAIHWGPGGWGSVKRHLSICTEDSTQLFLQFGWTSGTV